jgi:hypothetical protein
MHFPNGVSHFHGGHPDKHSEDSYAKYAVRFRGLAEPLRRHGVEVVNDRCGPDTLLVIWNRYSANHETALRVERAGGRVLVAENGFVASGGGTPKFDVYSAAGGQGGHYYSLAEGWHNGAGRWPAGGPERWLRLGVEVRPWRGGGEYHLVCPNRSFGVPGRMMHPDWPRRKAEQIGRESRFPVRLRPHPGNSAPKVALEADLAGARAVHVWQSTSGVHALVAGVPVFCDSPTWIMKGAASSGSVDEPTLPDRAPHFERLAWAQWTVDEIASGEPFRHLLPAAGQG